jgi:low temperature requirement protein LtrA
MTERKRAIRPMHPRDPAEPHRAATALELLFDLVTVIAIAAAAEGLHHAIAEAHAGQGVLRFALAFFAIWWAWMNFTWFASAYDNDDAVFRLLTMVIMAGSLALAAGVDALFRALDIHLVVAGYVVMRLAMVLLWLRAAGADPARRTTNLCYAGGIAVVQLYWVLLVVLGSPGSTAFVPLMLLGFLLELGVPAFAERATTTPWHRHHIVERYGLLTLIVLGEILLGASLALQAAAREAFDVRLVHVALSALVITFAMWWLYFCEEEQLHGSGLRRALLWGYGHLRSSRRVRRSVRVSRCWSTSSPATPMSRCASATWRWRSRSRSTWPGSGWSATASSWPGRRASSCRCSRWRSSRCPSPFPRWRRSLRWRRWRRRSAPGWAIATPATMVERP